MHNEPINRPIREGEGPEAKRLVYTVAHPLIELQKSLVGLRPIMELVRRARALGYP